MEVLVEQGLYIWHAMQWKDYLEIIALTLFFFASLRYFSSYSHLFAIKALYAGGVIVLLSHLMELPAIQSLIVSNFALAILISLFLPYAQLGGIGVARKRIVASLKSKHEDWLEVLLRVLLQRAYQDGSVMAVIERRDSLENMLYTTLPFQAPLTEVLLNKALILHANNHYIWVRDNGYLVAIDALLPMQLQERKDLFDWQQQALFLTHNNDAIVIYVHGNDKKITIVAQQTFVEDINCTIALNILRKYLKNNVIFEGKHVKNYNQSLTP